MKTIYKYTFLVTVALMGVTSSWAQAPSDAYRNIQEGITGTARTKAMGGAVGAIGADAGAAYVNPAGAALFSRTTIGIGLDVGKGSITIGDIRRELTLGGLNNVSYFGRSIGIPVSSNNSLRFNFGFNVGQEYNYNRES